MRKSSLSTFLWRSCLLLFPVLLLPNARLLAADKLTLIYTARVMSQSYPWIAHEAGLFKKYDLDVPLVFVTPGAPAVAAILTGDSEVTVTGAASITRPFVQGNKDPAFLSTQVERGDKVCSSESITIPLMTKAGYPFR